MTFRPAPFSAPGGKNHQKQQASRFRKALLFQELKNEIVGARTRDLRIKSPLLYQLSYDLKEKILHDNLLSSRDS